MTLVRLGMRKGFLAIGMAALAVAGCSKGSGSWGSGSDADKPSQALAAVPSPSAAPPMAGLDFGDDNGKFSRDGECDDPRFSGAGMTKTPLLDSDIKHDASDCQKAFNQGRLAIKEDNAAAAGAVEQVAARTENSGAGSYDSSSSVDRIIWGDDNGKYSRDGECDDKRFTGAGMTDTPLLDSDIKHDATDCRTAFKQGRLTLSE